MDRESAIKCINVSLKAQQMLSDANDDMLRLPEPVRVFLQVNGAQGVIDNGGFRYFFEADWPGNPPYETFAAAYEAIGCWKQAAEIRRVAKTFPCADPHLHKELRNEYIQEQYDAETMSVGDWGDELCGDDEVWKKLAAYYDWHKPHFQVAEKPELAFLRFPTRHARDADWMASIAFFGGIYFLYNRGTTEVSPWISGCGVISIIAGVLLWLRVPHAKWLGVVAQAVILGVFVRGSIIRGWNIIGCLELFLPVTCAYLMARIDYAHVADDEEDD